MYSDILFKLRCCGFKVPIKTPRGKGELVKY
jgi:hypothetical protein